MATSNYFNNFNSFKEQTLIEDLIIESIKIYGHDVYYLPRTLIDVDPVFTEEELSKFRDAIMVEVYIKNVEGFGGEGDFLSKFNFETHDKITFTIAIRRFQEEIGTPYNMVRPKEGDIIYLPLTRNYYEIRFVEHESIFYQLGDLQVYDLICENFEYNSEQFDTGIPDIDRIEDIYSLDIIRHTYKTEQGLYLTDEDGNLLVTEQYDYEIIDPLAQNDDFEAIGDEIIDFSLQNPFSEKKRY